MQEFFINLIPSYFHWWHVPVVFLTGMIAEGYGIVIGSGSVLTQFVLLSLGMPLPVVIATDIGGSLGAGVGVVTAMPKNIWDNKKLLLLLGIPFFIGGIIGTVFLTKISTVALKYVLIAALSCILFYMLVGRNRPTTNLQELKIKPKQYSLIGSIMLGLGIYTNVSGVGAGTFQKMIYTSLLRVKFVDGLGITNIIYFPPTIFSIIMTAIAGLLAWPYLITLWVGTFIGGHLVVKYIRKIPDVYLRVLLAILVFAYLVYLLWSLI